MSCARRATLRKSLVTRFQSWDQPGVGRMTVSRMDVSCVDLFCGAGGLTHGFVQEGLRVDAGIDLDPACRYPYSANNDATFVQRDISGMEASEVAKLFTPGTIWVLAGCAPCQPFSTYSQRYDTKADHKWGLLYEFARIAAGVMPDIVTMENVPAIRRHEVFDDFVKTLLELGYEVWHDVVDCAAYGVPQSRKRMVLLASLHGPIELIEPLRDEKGYKTVRQAIGRLRPIGAENRIRETNCTSLRNSPRRTSHASEPRSLGVRGETGLAISWPSATGSIPDAPTPVCTDEWSGTNQRRRSPLNVTGSATGASDIQSRIGRSRYVRLRYCRVSRGATSSSLPVRKSASRPWDA